MRKERKIIRARRAKPRQTNSLPAQSAAPGLDWAIAINLHTDGKAAQSSRNNKPRRQKAFSKPGNEGYGPSAVSAIPEAL